MTLSDISALDAKRTRAAIKEWVARQEERHG